MRLLSCWPASNYTDPSPATSSCCCCCCQEPVSLLPSPVHWKTSVMSLNSQVLRLLSHVPGGYNT